MLAISEQNSSPKKVLIVTMTCGEGHNSVSRAIKESLSDLSYEIKQIELFGYSQWRVDFENWQCLTTTKLIPRSYHIVWNSLNRANPERRDKLAIHGLMKKALKYITHEYNTFKPDVVIGTHPYSAVALSNLKRDKVIADNVKGYSVLTDYCVHPLWEAATFNDYVFTPANNTNKELIRRGFTAEQIVPIGYAVPAKFKTYISKSDARRILNLDEKFSVMAMSGGFGMRDETMLLKALMSLKDELNVICVCGRNAKNKKKLDKFVKNHNLTNVTVLGFVDNIEVLMSACDCLVTISGGVSITEALYKNIPLIIRENMRTNCKLNAKFLEENNCALLLDKLKNLPKYLMEIKNNSTLRENMLNAQKNVVNCNAAEDMAKFITERL